MTRKLSAEDASREFDEIVDRAVERNERFLVERNGEPAILILSVADYVRAFAPPLDWLKECHEDASRTGVDKITTEDIDVEIAEDT